VHRMKCDVDEEKAAKAKGKGKGSSQATAEDESADEDDDPDRYQLRGIFWMTPSQVEEGKRYHHVMIHDNTYRCNKFGMALGLFTTVNNHGSTALTAQCLTHGESTEDYVWAYKCYLHACERAPRVVLTDRCPAVEAAVAICFPTTIYHFWCAALSCTRYCIDFTKFARL
jgi:hypothetical protein